MNKKVLKIIYCHQMYCKVKVLEEDGKVHERSWNTYEAKLNLIKQNFIEKYNIPEKRIDALIDRARALGEYEESERNCGEDL